MNASNARSPEESLARAPLFARLSKKSLRKLAELSVPRDYAEGSEMITEGGTGLGLFIITSGKVSISKGNAAGRMTLAEMGPGDLLGEMALIDDQPRSATATALEDTRCLLITRNSFQTLVRNDPEVAWCIVPTLAERIRQLQQQMIAGGVQGWADSSSSDTDSEAAPDVLDDPPQPLQKKRSFQTDDLLVQILRGQHAFTIASVAGARGLLESLERFLRTLASDTNLDRAGSAREVAAELPKGLTAAANAGLGEMERIPERMIERYRRYRRGETDR